ncbi:MAG: beta-glucosidase [Chloroflexi bacterium]|nr:beta-glucosidase [Chloroflexota bacterium]
MLDEQIGQLIWAFISNMEDFASAEQAARAGRISGIWLLPTQMHSPAETAELVNRVQAAAKVPLLIGVDAEAGLGLVMGGATYLPTAMALGAANDPDLVRAAAEVTAAEARACGINAVAAPVLDVNINPANPIINTRSFGASPELVGRLGTVFVDGLQAPVNGRQDVLAIGKHFPGHGDTVEDSHLKLAAVRQPRERLDAVELPPFRDAIAADAAMLMTSHVAYPALDPAPDQPATLSRPILTDLLRNEMGYQGVVVTDCMNMYSIAHNFEPRESHVQAVAAGCDLLLTHVWDLAFDALKTAVREGTLAEEQIACAAQRVRKIKVQIFGESMSRPASLDLQTVSAAVGSPESAQVAKRIATGSVTVVRGTLTSPGDRPLIIATRMARRFGPSVDSQLRTALAAIGWENANVLMVDPTPDTSQVRKAVEQARIAHWAALLHFNRVASFDPEAVSASDELADLAATVSAAGVAITVASLGSPYVLPRFAAASATLCTYSTCDAALHAVLHVLRGDTRAPGTLPVELQ